ncbi:hypothetical protein HPPN120_05835 [Helicobacter pylori Puno120]|nr:hypothetical protein HPPN120_05835 [Helicobacter pylori Puno120]
MVFKLFLFWIKKDFFEGFLTLFISLITFFAMKLILGSVVKQE